MGTGKQVSNSCGGGADAPTGLSSKTRWVCRTIQNISGLYGDFFFHGAINRVQDQWNVKKWCEVCRGGLGIRNKRAGQCERGEAKREDMRDIRCAKVEGKRHFCGNLLHVGVHIYAIGCICSRLSALVERRMDMTGLSFVSPRIIASGLPEATPTGYAENWHSQVTPWIMFISSRGVISLVFVCDLHVPFNSASTHLH